MAENPDNRTCPQRDRAEHFRAGGSITVFSTDMEGKDSAQPKLLEEMIKKDNLNRAYKRVKANKGAPGVDGMTIEEAYSYLRENS